MSNTVHTDVLLLTSRIVNFLSSSYTVLLHISFSFTLIFSIYLGNVKTGRECVSARKKVKYSKFIFILPKHLLHFLFKSWKVWMSCRILRIKFWINNNFFFYILLMVLDLYFIQISPPPISDETKCTDSY